MSWTRIQLSLASKNEHNLDIRNVHGEIQWGNNQSNSSVLLQWNVTLSFSPEHEVPLEHYCQLHGVQAHNKVYYEP